MNNKTYSVIVVDKNGKTIKQKKVNEHVYFHWKKYTSAILLLMLTVTYFIYDWNQRQFESYFLQKTAQIEAEKIQEQQQAFIQSLNTIDTYVSEVNEVLAQKGLATIPNLNAETLVEDGNTMLATNSYIQQLNTLANNLSTIPLGLPHDGRITSQFGFRIDPVTGAANDAHRGIDFKGNIGDPVAATAHGKIAFAGVKGGYGKCVIIEHDKGYKTLYAHLSAIDVKEGQSIKSGNIIGKLGNTGKSTGPHLHYEVIKNDVKVNPAKFLSL